MSDELNPDGLQGLEIALELTAYVVSGDSLGEGDGRGLFANRANFIQDINDRYLAHVIFIFA